MGKDHWDAILASAPLNATAGTVTSKGYQYEPDKQITQLEWENPPPMSRHPREMPDMVGQKVGRLTAVGFLAESRPGKPRWVCRCACGRYVTRSTKAIRNEANAEDRCSLCRHTAFLAQQASGSRPRERAESDKARKWKPDEAA